MKERLFRQQIKAKRRSSYYEGRQRETLQYVERRRIMYTCNSSSGQKWSNLNLLKKYFSKLWPSRTSANFKFDWSRKILLFWKKCPKCAGTGWFFVKVEPLLHSLWRHITSGWERGKEKRNGRVEGIYEPPHVMLQLQSLSLLWPSPSATEPRLLLDDSSS